MKPITLFALIFSFCTACSSGLARETVFGVYPGLLNESGKDASISQPGGRLTIVNFLASWCASCVGELPALEALSRELKEEGLRVVGIGVDDTEAGFKKFRESRAYDIPLLFDREGTVRTFYKVRALPKTIVLDETGRQIPFFDAESGTLVEEARGPRDWSDKKTVSFFRTALLEKAGR